MLIQIDSREHKSELNRICKQFDELGIQYFISKLYVADYMNYDNPRKVVDRKKDLQELCGNVCQQHDRFRRELLSAKENGIQVTILCEHGEDIKCLEDVIFWENPRCTCRKKIDGKWQTVKTKATTGETLYKILSTLEEKYDCKFEFCNKTETGKRIMELLQ